MTIKKLLCIVCALVMALGCVAFAEEARRRSCNGTAEVQEEANNTSGDK